MTKMEIIWLATGHCLHQLPKQPIRVGSDLVMPVSLAHHPEIYIDSDMSMRSHVSKTVSACFAVLRQL